MKPINVSIIGAGNLVWHLAPALDNTEFAVREIYSRDPKNAEAIVDKLYQADVKLSLDFSNSNSGVFIIAVKDDVIREIAEKIKLPEKAILVHTSGSQPLSILASAATPNIGVFYPLQTFSKGKKLEFEDIPFFIESENPETAKVLTKIAKTISKKVSQISSDDRKALHVSAVFASNFTNHMLTVAKEIMREHKLNFDLLKPLIAETLNKSLQIDPSKAQTGPARRGDLEILDRHMEFLAHDASLAEVYKVISQHIVDKYHG